MEKEISLLEKENIRRSKEMKSNIVEILMSLSDLRDHYVSLIKSGDCGSWNPNTEEVVKNANKVLKKHEGKVSKELNRRKISTRRSQMKKILVLMLFGFVLFSFTGCQNAPTGPGGGMLTLNYSLDLPGNTLEVWLNGGPLNTGLISGTGSIDLVNLTGTTNVTLRACSNTLTSFNINMDKAKTLYVTFSGDCSGGVGPPFSYTSNLQ